MKKLSFNRQLVAAWPEPSRNIQNLILSGKAGSWSSRKGLLYVVDHKGSSRLLRSYDPSSRQLVGMDTLKIEGRITAIAPNEQE